MEYQQNSAADIQRQPDKEATKSLQFETSRYDSLPIVFKIIFLVLIASALGLAIFYIFGFKIPGKQETLINMGYYYLLYALLTPCIFLILPMRKKDRRIPWYDVVLTALAFSIPLFYFFHNWEIRLVGWVPPPSLLISLSAFIFCIIALESSRRMAGLPFLIVIILIGIYPIFADYMPGVLWGKSFTPEETMSIYVFSFQGMPGLPGKILGELIIGFLIFAGVMVSSGAGEFFLKMAFAIFGKYRGGPAKVAVVGSGFFGSMSGSIFANIASTGAFTIPAMKRLGYPPRYAGAIEACASTGGVIMPPVMGSIAFIMAVLLNVEYREIIVVAFLPALLYYFGLLIQVDAYAARVGLRGLPREEVPSLLKTLKEGWPFLAVFLFLLWGLLYMRWETRAPFYASALMIILSFTSRRTMMTPQRAVQMLVSIGRLLTMTVAVILPVGIIIAGLSLPGMTISATYALVNMGGGNLWLVLIIGVIITYLLGMIGIGAYLFLAITLAPAIIQIGGFDKIVVHFFILYYSLMAFITPPVALGSFLGAAIANANPMKTAITSMRLGVVIYFIPFFFLFNPALVLRGTSAFESFYLFILCLIGILFVAAGMEGYLLKLGKLSVRSRLFFIVGGALIAYPSWIPTLAGSALVILVIVLALIPEKLKGYKPIDIE